MRIQPDGVNLLETVGALLKEEILPELEGSKAYELRMALNAIGIARRQLQTGDRVEETEREVLAVMLDAEPEDADLERRFAQLVREGTVAGDDALCTLLWNQTLNRVRESAPRYLRQEGLEE